MMICASSTILSITGRGSDNMHCACWFLYVLTILQWDNSFFFVSACFIFWMWTHRNSDYCHLKDARITSPKQSGAPNQNNNKNHNSRGDSTLRTYYSTALGASAFTIAPLALCHPGCCFLHCLATVGSDGLHYCITWDGRITRDTTPLSLQSLAGHSCP
jgi:hypothetical protein